MASIVNTDAATWVIDYLNLPSYKAAHIREYGVSALVVRDLKMLWRAIEPLHPTLRMKSQAAKNKWVDAVVTALNTPGLVMSLPRTPIHQSYVPVRPCAGTVPPPRNFAPLVSAEPLFDCPFERSLQVMFGDANMLLPAPLPISPSASFIAPSNIGRNTTTAITQAQKRKRDDTTTIKLEPGGLSIDRDPQEAPRTLQEAAMVHQLHQMGFSDECEMLEGIRHVTSQDLNKRVDDAMLWIVQQREEAEEAKKIDAVRARSEQLRQEQAENRRRNKKERVDAATMQEWATEREFFQGSVVLQFAYGVLEGLRTNGHKQVLVDFLELEKNARKWFGPRVPFCFFANLSKQWTDDIPMPDLVNSIKEATAVVQRGLFSLSEQQGGVPKVFLLAKKDFEEQGLQTGPEGTEDDDEVMVIEKYLWSEHAQSNETHTSRDVIEIDL